METVKGSKFSIAKPGSKASSAIEAGVTLTPTINKFSFNGLATKLIGFISGTGDKDEPKTPENSVTILSVDYSTDVNNKFYVCQGIEGSSAKLAAHENEEGAGKELACTYSGIYAQIVMAVVKGDVNSPAVSKERLRQEGFAEDGTLLHKIYAKLESIGVQDVDGNERELFRMYDFMITPHTPKTFKAKAKV